MNLWPGVIFPFITNTKSNWWSINNTWMCHTNKLPSTKILLLGYTKVYNVDGDTRIVNIILSIHLGLCPSKCIQSSCNFFGLEKTMWNKDWYIVLFSSFLLFNLKKNIFFNFYINRLGNKYHKIAKTKKNYVSKIYFFYSLPKLNTKAFLKS